MSLIDLDRPAEPPAGVRRRRAAWRASPGVVVAMLLGAVLGGLVTYSWTVQQRRDADERQVSVLLFADTRASEIGAVVADSVRPDGVQLVDFHAAIAVVNAGPRPIQVQSLTVRTAGLTVAGSRGSQWIAPGTTSLVDVDVTWGCVRRRAGGGTTVIGGGGTIPATVSIETVGGPVKSVSPVSVDTTPWAKQWDEAAQKCVQASWPRGFGI